MSNKFALFFRPQFSVKLPRFAKISKKVCSFLCSLSLITNIFLPYFSVIPVYATDTGFFSTQIEYSASSHKLSITTNSSEKIEYQLFYKTVDKIDSIAGIDLAATNISDAFYLGTCSAESICLPQDFSRGVLKLKSFANQIFSQSFTLENNTLTIVKEGDSFQFDLTDEENNFLSPWTFENVELNKEYENSGVKLTFTELPENSGNIKIQEITLIPEQIEQTGAISDKAYDITSDMSDGTFVYNLSLPIPDSSTGKTVDVKYAEDISKIASAEKVDNTITNTDTSVSVKSLDHFTIFVVVGATNWQQESGGACINPVNNDGDANGNCFGTIQAAINAAKDGDTIIVAAGTYNENLVINKSLHLQGAGSNQSIINAGESIAIEVTADNVVIDGFEIKHVTVNSLDDMGIRLNQNNGSIIQNNKININSLGLQLLDAGNNDILTNNFLHNVVGIYFEGTTDGTNTDGGSNGPFYSLSLNNNINGNIITNSVILGGQGGDGIYLDAACESNTINNNTITNNAANGYYAWKASKNTITNNTISNNGDNGIQLMGSSNNAINGNTVNSNSNYGFLIRSGALSSTNNIIINNTIGENTTAGILLKDSLEIGYDGVVSGNTINSNKITGSGSGVVTESSPIGTVYDLEKNWWGSNIESDIQSKVTANVDYDPWYIDSEMTILSSDPPIIPTATFTSGGNVISTNSFTKVDTFSFNLSSSPNASYYKLRYWNDILGSYYKETTPWTKNNLTNVYSDHFSQGEGKHYFTFSSCNIANICSDYSEPFIITYDTTVPSVPTLVFPVNIAINDNTPLMQWDDSTDVNGSGIAGYFYRVYYNCTDPNDFNTCTKVYPNILGTWLTSSQYQAGGTANSVYYWQVKAKDLAGNESGWSDVEKVTIDTTPPGKPTISSPVLEQYFNSAPILNQWGVLTDFSGIKQYIIEYVYDDNHTFSGAPYRYTTTNSRNHSPGTNEQGGVTIRVRGEDNAGNIGQWSDPIHYTYDATAPVVPNLISPLNNSFVKGNSITNSWSYIPDATKYIYESYHDDSAENLRWHQEINSPVHSKTATNVADSIFWWRVKAVDLAGNESEWSDLWKITVDNTPPVITVNPFITNSKTPSLSGTINDNTASISVQVNSITYTGTNNGDGTWGVNISNTLPDGTYNIIASAADTAGNIGNDVTSDELIVDTIAPIATYKHYIDNVEFKGSIAYVNNLNKLTFTGEYSDFNPSSQLLKDSYVIFDAQTDHSFNFSQNGAKAYCSWRTKPNLVDLSGNLFSLTTKELFSNCISNLPDDEYYIAHQVYDNAVRHDIPSITQFRDVIGLHFIIDTVNPSSKISLPINNGTNSVIYSNSWDGSISGTASDDISGIMGVKVSIQNGLTQYFDGSGFNSATEILLDTTYLTGTWEYSDLTTPPAGSYTIRSHAIDNAGNTENTYTLTIILDKTIDEVTLSINPSVGDASNGWYKTQPTVTLTQTDDNFDRIEYQWDSQSGNWTTYSNPFKSASEGAHVLYYRAVDKANNISTVGVKNIKWDQTDLEYGPQNISANPNPTSTSTSKITWEAAKDNIGIDKYEVQWSLNGLNYSKTVGAGTTEVEIDQLTEGRWTVKVIAFDGSGRTKDNSIDVVVDRSGPIAPVLTLAGTGVGTATLSWNTVSDAKDYIVWYGNSPGSRLYGARVGNVTTYTVKGLGAGNYYFIVKAVDEAQNQGAESNEVNTGTIAGVLNVEPNTPAEGFTPEVLGIDTGKLTTPTPSPAVSVSDVLGVSVENTPQWYWLWLLLLIPLYLILRRLFKRNQNN